MTKEWLLAIETSGLPGSVALALAGRIITQRTLSEKLRNAAALLPAVRDLLRETGQRISAIGTVAYSSGPGSFTGLRVAVSAAQMLQSTLGCQVVAVPTLEVIARNALPVLARGAFENETANGTNSGVLPRIVALLDAKGGQVYAAVFEWSDETTKRQSDRATERQSDEESERAAQASAMGSVGVPPANHTIQPPPPASANDYSVPDPVRPQPSCGELCCVEPAALRTLATWLPTLRPPVCVLGSGLRTQRGEAEAAGAIILDERFWQPRAEELARIGWQRALSGHFCAPHEIRPLYLRPPECEQVYESRRAAAKARRM